jgi:hypothetical protein
MTVLSTGELMEVQRLPSHEMSDLLSSLSVHGMRCRLIGHLVYSHLLKILDRPRASSSMIYSPL